MLPSFETSRFPLHPRTMADFDARLAMDRDPDATRYIRALGTMLGSLVVDIGPRSTPSMRVAEKIGMTFVSEGTCEDGNPCWS